MASSEAICPTLLSIWRCAAGLETRQHSLIVDLRPYRTHIDRLFHRRDLIAWIDQTLILLNQMHEAARTVVGEDIVHIAGLDPLFVLLPELRFE